MSSYANAKRELMCREYVTNGFDEIKAYVTVYKPANVASCKSVVTKIMKQPDVIARIAELRKHVEAEIIFDSAAVLREWIAIATADVGELVKVRRCNCRYCWGVDGAYQWVNEREFLGIMGDWLSRSPKTRGKQPTDEGGYGYVEKRAPRVECAECGGEGTSEVVLTPTDDLSHSARKLYDGAKMGKYGIEIAVRSRDKALENLARAMGILTPSNDPKTPQTVDVTPPALPVDPIEASRTYTEWLKNSG